ncbi:hypothetical protein MRB53_023731 [Persea americana]|uniref:Uncharacterized protein n=1 Tax=Persea americana TaxID=3435 RepID=A0ACC2LB82_PERAE|nr:hypothetical protein MRB53_023731 [Persea americana]
MLVISQEKDEVNDCHRDEYLQWYRRITRNRIGRPLQRVHLDQDSSTQKKVDRFLDWQLESFEKLEKMEDPSQMNSFVKSMQRKVKMFKKACFHCGIFMMAIVEHASYRRAIEYTQADTCELKLIFALRLIRFQGLENNFCLKTMGRDEEADLILRKIYPPHEVETEIQDLKNSVESEIREEGSSEEINLIKLLKTKTVRKRSDCRGRASGLPTVCRLLENMGGEAEEDCKLAQLEKRHVESG